jgi:hypothetical protein
METTFVSEGGMDWWRVVSRCDGTCVFGVSGILGFGIMTMHGFLVMRIDSGTMTLVSGLGLFIGVTWQPRHPTTRMLPSATITLPSATITPPYATTPNIVKVSITSVL